MRGLGLGVAQLLGADLGGGHRLAALAQPRLDLGLLGGAGAQLGGHALARLAVGGQLGLEASTRARDRLEDAGERRRPARSAAGSSARSRASAASRRAIARGALGALAGGALGDAALGGQLALELRAAHGRLALLRAPAALLDQPRGAALGSSVASARARSASRSARSASSRVASAACDGVRGGLDGAQRRLLGLHGALGLGDQRVAAVALGEHALGAAARRLAQLARGAEPGAAGRA